MLDKSQIPATGATPPPPLYVIEMSKHYIQSMVYVSYLVFYEINTKVKQLNQAFKNLLEIF